MWQPPFFFFFNLFFWLHRVFIDSRGPSLVAAIKSYSLVVVYRLLIAAVSLVLKHTKREMSKYVPTVGTGLQYLWCTGLVAHLIWNLPGPRIESVSPALAGELLSTGPRKIFLMRLHICFFLFPKGNKGPVVEP